MALWKATNERTGGPSGSTTAEPPVNLGPLPAPSPHPAAQPSPRPNAPARVGESLIAANLVIEGKIEGVGHVRIAGHFNGDVHVDGDLTIEPGAKVTGGVRAKRVIVGGELDGNIDAASTVELAATGVLNGDLKAGSLTVAAGSRMRGKVEFGWEDKVPAKPNGAYAGNGATGGMHSGNGAAGGSSIG
jgi:cytoskeletal protein CcmA (bactofilin family)